MSRAQSTVTGDWSGLEAWLITGSLQRARGRHGEAGVRLELPRDCRRLRVGFGAEGGVTTWGPLVKIILLGE